MDYLGGRTDMLFQDGSWELADCLFQPSLSIVGPNEFCPLGTTGFIAQGDIDGDGVNDQGSFWSVGSITPASQVEPFRPDLFRLISAPPSGFTRILRSTDGDVSAIFDVIDASVIVWYNTLNGIIDDNEVTIYSALREYGVGDDELERHYEDVPWGPYKFGLPQLVPSNSSQEPGQIIFGVDHIVTPDAWPGRGALPQGWRNSNEEWGENGELEMDPRIFYDFKWSGLTPSNTLQSDNLLFSLNANQFINPEGIEETKYAQDTLGRGTVTGLSCFNTITTDLNLDEVLEEGKIYELVFTSGRLSGTELATQYPITAFGDSGDVSVFRVVTRDEGYTWDEAREAAEAAGGRLAVLDSQGKRDFVNSQLVGAGFETADGEWPSMWIGLSDSEEEGVWRWNTGQILAEQPSNFQDIGNVADAFAPFEVNTFTSAADTELGLYDADGNLVLSNDDAGGGLQSQLDFPSGLEPGFYFLAVGTFETVFDQNSFGVFLGGPGGPYTLTHPTGVETGELGAASFEWYRLGVGSPVEGGIWEEGAPTVDPPENEFDFAHILGGVSADGSAPLWFDEEGTVELEAFLLEIPLLNSNEIVLPGASDLTGGIVTGSFLSGTGFELETNRPLGEPNCLQPGQTYRLEITSGQLAGTTQFPVTTWADFTLTTIGDDPLPFDLAGVPSLAPGDSFVLTPENVNATFSVGYVGSHFIEASDALNVPADFSTLVRGADYRIEFLTGELAGTSDTVRNWGFPTNSYLETQTNFFGQLAVGDIFSIDLIELPTISVAVGDQFVIGQIFEDWIQDKYDAGEVLAVDGETLSLGYGIPATDDLVVGAGPLGPLYAVARPETIVFPPYPIEVAGGDRSPFVVGTLDNHYELGPFFFNPGDSVDASLDLSRSSVSGQTSTDAGSYDLSFRVQFIDTYEGFAILGGLGDDTGFPFATPSSEREPDYDFDRDGATNLLEYALGSNVADPNSRPAFLYALDEEAGSCTATLEKRPFTGTSLDYFFEYSTDLRTWTTIGDDDPIFDIVVDDDENLQVTNLSNFPGELAAPACFLRVRVEIR